jgi:hypothetical protein
MKKLIPMTMISTLNAILEPCSTLYTKLAINDSTLHLIDADEFDSSDFFFKVGLPNSNDSFNVTLKPISADAIREMTYPNLNIQTVQSLLKNWIGILKLYSTPSVFDNPARYHSNNIFTEFKIADDNADTIPFEYPKLLLLDNLLLDLIAEVEILESAENDELKQSELKVIINDFQLLRDESSSMTKNKVVEKLSRTLGKLLKLGVKYFKPVISKFKEIFIKKIADTSAEQIAEQIIDFGTNILN